MHAASTPLLCSQSSQAPHAHTTPTAPTHLSTGVHTTPIAPENTTSPAQRSWQRSAPSAATSPPMDWPPRNVDSAGRRPPTRCSTTPTNVYRSSTCRRIRTVRRRSRHEAGAASVGRSVGRAGVALAAAACCCPTTQCPPHTRVTERTRSVKWRTSPRSSGASGSDLPWPWTSKLYTATPAAARCSNTASHERAGAHARSVTHWRRRRRERASKRAVAAVARAGAAAVAGAQGKPVAKAVVLLPLYGHPQPETHQARSARSARTRRGSTRASPTALPCRSPAGTRCPAASAPCC
jgi:hypothetical protein